MPDSLRCQGVPTYGTPRSSALKRSAGRSIAASGRGLTVDSPTGGSTGYEAPHSRRRSRAAVRPEWYVNSGPSFQRKCALGHRDGFDESSCIPLQSDQHVGRIGVAQRIGPARRGPPNKVEPLPCAIALAPEAMQVGQRGQRQQFFLSSAMLSGGQRDKRRELLAIRQEIGDVAAHRLRCGHPFLQERSGPARASTVDSRPWKFHAGSLIT